MSFRRATLVVITLVMLMTSQLVTNQTLRAESQRVGRSGAPTLQQEAQYNREPISGGTGFRNDRQNQDIRDSASKHVAPTPRRKVNTTADPSCPSSPFAPPETNDTTFVTDCGGGLDTGCTFRSGGP